MTTECPHCHGRYAFNTCPGGYDNHVRAINEDTPDGQPERCTTRLESLEVAMKHNITAHLTTSEAAAVLDVCRQVIPEI